MFGKKKVGTNNDEIELIISALRMLINDIDKAVRELKDNKTIENDVFKTTHTALTNKRNKTEKLINKLQEIMY